MDWVSRLNQAVGYIESRLRDDMDMDEIARIVLCPISIFQRFFMLSTGITLTEYIRRRRLTCAVDDLLRTKDKIVTIAMRYGYETSDAFGVAFKRLYGVTPSAARQSQTKLKRYYRLYFTLSATYIKEADEMILQNVDHYRAMEPLFEGVRVILAYLGEEYTHEYIQGVSGAAFRIAGGCPSRPTCIYSRWTPDFVRYMGYEATEYACFDADENDISGAMIDAVKRQIDMGRPVLVWNAFTNLEWDVVCGYDKEQQQFIGRGSYKGLDEYDREPWMRARNCDITFGAIIIGNKRFTVDAAKIEKEALREAVKHARKTTDSDIPHEKEGIQFYRYWADAYQTGTKERDAADAYCYDVYSSTRRAGVGFLKEIAPKYEERERKLLIEAASFFEMEVQALIEAKSYLSWESPWGIDVERNKAVAPLLSRAVANYEKGIDCLEKILFP